jgi:GntR family transcriptional regulator, N-acetylglucosamine utilization regulator
VILEDGPMPFYFQIKSILRARILSNELKAGDLVASEVDLSQEYHVSRGTVRQALSELINEGLIYRIRGKGTFVSEDVGLRELKFKGTIENLITSAMEGKIKILEYKEVIAPPPVAKILRTGTKQRVFQLEVIFSSSKGATRYSVLYLPPHLGKMISRDELKDTTEIILLAEEKSKTKIHHAHQSMNIALADARISKYLSIEQKTPIFVIERQYYARNRSPIYMSISYCRPDLYKFKIELVRG